MSDRPATISPSQLKCLMAKKGLGKGAASYADKIVMRKIGVDLDEYESYEMAWGNEHEPNAIYAYERETFSEVQEKQRLWHPEHEFISGEPDGLVGEDGIIEIKCPKSKWHLANIRTGAQIKKYQYQMQGYMWLTGRSWCDFTSYDPRFPDGMQLAIHRVERNDAIIDLIEERCLEFWETMVQPKLKELQVPA